MPELPEVETTCRALEPVMIGRTLLKIETRTDQLRKPLTDMSALHNAQIQQITRRGKYIIIETDKGSLLVHLGMTGAMRICARSTPLKIHDYVIFHFSDYQVRLHDPRKFGYCGVMKEGELNHLGIEPLTHEFTGEYLFNLTRKKRTALKTFIMKQENVVGVGNIYANESLFMSGLSPHRPAGSLASDEANLLVACIKKVLEASIIKGGTTLKDFSSPNGANGHFIQDLLVYGKYYCPHDNLPLEREEIGGRSTFWCARCQK